MENYKNLDVNIYGCTNLFPWSESMEKLIIESFSGLRHLSTILLKDFNLFKIVESIINFCLKIFFN